MSEHVEAVRGTGPTRPLPDRRAHELFEERVRQAPSHLAVVHRDTRWTYADLDAAADRVAGALLAGGLEPESVVAVIGRRSPDWLAAIVGIFKAGGVYLPIDPAYPDERIADLLRRSGCRVALIEDAASAAPVHATGCRALPLRPAEIHERRAARVEERALAYVYFTSGSTGAPKGAACEHLGMLNHLLAKAHTFQLGRGSVVAQTASQCFDISLWQALAPLVVGGTTVIVDPEVMLDVPAFLRLLDAENVEVLQLVPSYLDVLVTRLEQGDRAPRSLRWLGVTGEAVSRQVLARWFEQCPQVPVVNAYGATESSDDATHAVMHSLADADPVTVGVPIANVFVDVIGPDGLPVEDDTIGEITFSGLCVGRGYLNDPERTREAFGDDPVRPGVRRYRTGDYGHWLPDGRLRFVGRKDEQVKVSGIRVETGEVEAQLLRVPGVRSACVIAVPDGAGKRLAGFYTAASPIPGIRDLLAELLPAQLVPRTLRRLPELPLTGNGKVDRRRLADLEAGSASRAGSAGRAGRAVAAGSPGGAGGEHVTPPRSATERRIAAAWAQVLDLPLDGIGRDDDFFAHGGGSLAAVRLVVRLGGLISLADLMAHPVLADLAAAADGAGPGETSLLQALAVPEKAAVALVCVPYEAGNALNFGALARELSSSDVAVYAVELPGHDVARPDDELAGLDRLAARLSQEILDRIDVPVALWGHGAGAALALETGRSLQDAGAPPRHLFLAAAAHQEPAHQEPAHQEPAHQEPAHQEPAHREPAQQAPAQQAPSRQEPGRQEPAGHGADDVSSAKVAAWLRDAGALTDLDQWRPARGELIERAYRHDLGEAERYLRACAATLDLPATIITVPRAPGESGGAARCTAILPKALITRIEDGGRYFIRTHPAAGADLVTATIGARQEGGSR